MLTPDQEQKIEVCKWWLDRGFALLPIQPNTKFLFAGYGESADKKKIVTIEQAMEIVRKFPSANLAVLCDDRQFILDFDKPDLYTCWADKHPDYAKTFTERTPRTGAHVFLVGSAPAGLILLDGVEIKKRCLVYPSVVDGKAYTRGAGDIIEADNDCFFPLSKPGTKSAYVLQIEHADRARKQKRHDSNSIVEQIKQANRIEHVFSVYRPGTKFDSNSPFVSVLCPWHKDHKPSMFINLQGQYFKCHACGASGDVITLYSLFEGITNGEAIGRLARALRSQAVNA